MAAQPLRYERHIVLPKLLAQHAEDYEIGNTMYNQDSHKAGTARRYLCSFLKEHVNCYSIEVSMYGYNRKTAPGIVPYTEEACILSNSSSLGIQISTSSDLAMFL